MCSLGVGKRSGSGTGASAQTMADTFFEADIG